MQVGRVQNFKNWSPDLVPDPSKTSLGLEYFCFEGDDLWTMPDADLVALGRREIDAIGLVTAAEVIDGCVVRMPKAYPVYDDDYQAHLAVIRGWLKNAAQPRAGRPQRHAQVQQPGPFDDDRAPGRAEHPGPGHVRHLEGQHRRRVSRGRTEADADAAPRPAASSLSESPRSDTAPASPATHFRGSALFQHDAGL